MEGYNLVGRIRPVYRGAWDSGAAYTALEVVVSSDSHTAYIAKKDVPAGTALTDTAYWGVIADVRDLATAVGEALIDLDNMALKPPVIGENGNWQLWDFGLNAYVDSGLPSRGERGESDGGSGAGVVFATLTLNGSTYSCDMTYDEIQAEIEAGKLVRLKWQTNDATIRNYDYVGTFGLTTSPYVVFQYQSQTGYGTAFVYQNGTVNHYNGTLVRNSLTVNGHALTENVTLTAADVGALPNSDETWAAIDSRVVIATPVRGTDYWTEEDQAAVQDDCNTYIASELAKRGQLKPEFANSVEECTDTTKLYVLPDGYIYAYMYSEGMQFINVLEKAVDENDQPFNGGKGYDTGYRFNSSAALTALDGSAYTGFIPYDGTGVIRIFGLTSSSMTSSEYLYLYDDTKTKLSENGGGQMPNWISNGATLVQTSVGDYTAYMLTLDPDAIEDVKDYVANALRSAKYIRFNVVHPNTDCFWVSIGEEMIIGSGYAWTNTGHAFVPADYEDRIVALESTATDLNKRVTELESADIAGVPDYVKAAAEEVIDKVISAQGSRTFTFAAVSDLHYENGNYTDGVLHMSQALGYIGSRIKLDAFAVLGDYVSSYPSSDYTDSMDDFQDVNHLLNEMRFAPNLRVQGNHDFVDAKSPVVYRYVQSFSDDVVWGDRMGGYYYRDFADCKLRVIALNMMEANVSGDSGTGQGWSENQMNWLISSLDLTDKSDAAEWSILLISHHPLDWYYAGYTSGDNVTVVIPYILEAYRTGAAWSHNRLAVSCDFSGGKNAAKLIGNIHGHIHNYMVDYLYLNNGGAVKSGVKRISTPEACIGRANNSYVGSIWEDSATYAKTTGTVEDTAFCVYCIDLDSSTIHAIHYGAGIDREITY